MDLGNDIITLGIIIGLVIVVAILFVVQSYVFGKYKISSKLNGIKSEKSTYFLDEGEDEKKCEICRGNIADDPIAICTCGKIFHDACAKPTDACPYCGAKYETMEIRDPIKTRCPICGRFVKGNICECGAVLPRKDETFICKCGNRVDMSKPVCKKCGAIYESVSMHVYKEKK
ncbi:MAG: hypothetical protein RBR05_04365 [Candidatus Methanomethylophilaceae archaeon]|nr:hypothetical protein [Candidatus Methanomethylophilaceae archaeon]MDD3378458.1 hypothetical protein [Candidatus Methanomethylophilaceae archaeon]MDY0224613.1 hypothetical protein [Candidatus Methanomethylophilaceae archaeon]